MHFNHPKVKKLRLRPEERTAVETIVYHLSPEQIGRIGGEMAQRMVKAAQSYLEDIAVHEVNRAFYKEIHLDGNDNADLPAPSTQVISHSSAEAHANQYPGDTGPH